MVREGVSGGRSVMKNILKLIEFKTADGLFLPGLLFEPIKRTHKVAILLHGNGSTSVFYSVKEDNSMAQYLNRNRISYFPFNNRGAHYIKKLNVIEDREKKQVKFGTTFELIKDCIYDIDGAISFLRKQGYQEFYLIGHSTGANKICVYNFYKPKNKVSKYVLVGAGDDTGIWYEIMGKEKFHFALKRAKEKIAKGDSRKFIPKYLVDYLFSWQALYDTINPNGDYNIFPFNEYINNLKLSKKKLFREYKKIKKPTLVIFGSDDEYCYGDVPRIIEILKKECSVPQRFDFFIVGDANHDFHGKEEKLAKTISDWLIK